VTGTGSGEGSYTYDFNGNLVGAYPATLEWDAEDRLRAVVTGALRSEFTYDGLGRRVRIVEKNGSTVTSDKRFLWVGNEIAEERDASGGTVNKRYFSNGVLIGSSKYFYTKDHLGSIREATDNSGNILARYEYDPYGTRTRVSGAADADFGFTGHYLHVPSGLYLTKYRAYAPGLGRWISRDPIGERGGINLYGYVENNPSNDVDLLGLQGPAGAAWSMACRYVPPVFDKGNAAVAAAAAAASEAGKWAGGIWSDAGADAGPAASDNSDPTPDPTKAAPSDATGTDSGARSKWGQDAADQYDEITKAQGEAKKKRPKINDKNGEWDGAKKRPKQNKINSTGKSKGRPL
jgi:RHS repeat-associated protein